mmetsp:Transcript_36717/g.117985  ORF Transcript_36717/g.117985 Transcript_36717/m.117985 type:complete len:211 (+) Transcript_36717:463-1095(+)|eukprot:scaffold8868_cov103-Isochrysis_galbana.AAC.2
MQAVQRHPSRQAEAFRRAEAAAVDPYFEAQIEQRRQGIGVAVEGVNDGPRAEGGRVGSARRLHVGRRIARVQKEGQLHLSRHAQLQGKCHTLHGCRGKEEARIVEPALSDRYHCAVARAIRHGPAQLCHVGLSSGLHLRRRKQAFLSCGQRRSGGLRPARSLAAGTLGRSGLLGCGYSSHQDLQLGPSNFGQEVEAARRVHADGRVERHR